MRGLEIWPGGATKKQLRSFFSINKSETVLDAGCGSFPFPLATHLCDISGPETLGSVAVNRPQARPFYRCSVESMPFKDKQFDFVYCTHVLEHVEDPARACRELMRISKRGYIECPSSWHEYVFHSPDHKWLVDLERGSLIFREVLDEEEVDILGIQHALIDYIQDEDFNIYWKSRAVRRIRNIEFYWEGSFDVFVLPKKERKNAGACRWFYAKPGLSGKRQQWVAPLGLATLRSNEHRPDHMPDCTTLVELLRWRAQQQPKQIAYTFLNAGDYQGMSITYLELDQRARDIARRLQALGAIDERVLLLFPAGLDFIVAFFGCLYARAIAVPAYPHASRHNLFRISAILQDARPKVALSDANTAAQLASSPVFTGADRPPQWLVLEPDLPEDNNGSAPPVSSDTLALIQYTSGSTRSPKGVCLTHGNLLDNQRLIKHAFSLSENDRFAGWLPVYHDMGLIGNILQPLYLGVPCTLMSPMDFMQHPVRWLQAITREQATISGGPNFAFEHCVQKITADECRHLDLGSWRVAFNGSEPVRARTMQRFVARFREYGFRPESFYPCYGLAEASLIVSGHRNRPVARTLTVNRDAYQQGNIVATSVAAPETLTLVSCGRPSPGARIAIVDPGSTTRCPENRVGEIWVAGESVARGYWNRSGESNFTFGAYMADNRDSSYLRTGDLGFIHDGELYVSGRWDDRIILRGRIIYPQDIEYTIEHSQQMVHSGTSAVFSVDDNDTERIVAICEIPRATGTDYQQVIHAIRQAVSEDHEVQLHAVVLIRAHTLPRTTSGKVRRRACRDAFLNGNLAVIDQFRDTSKPAPANDGQLDQADISTWLVDEVARRSGIAAATVDVNRPLADFGLDSLAMVEIMDILEARFASSLSAVDLFRCKSIDDLISTTRQALTTSNDHETNEYVPGNDTFFEDQASPIWLGVIRQIVRLMFYRHFRSVWVDRAYAPPRDARTVYFLNHSSWWDNCSPLLLNEFVFHQHARFLTSHTMMSHRRWLRYVLQKAGCFSIYRRDPQRAVVSLQHARRILHQPNAALYMYPQGKMVTEDKDIQFKQGIGWLSSQLPVVDFVPVACYFHTLHSAKPMLFFRVGNPVHVDTGLSTTQRAQHMAAIMQTLLRTLRQDATQDLQSIKYGFRRLV
ncbi:MAG: AMP-binding protein [Gammaproteobacteria bacterium]|jgi:acyl-CoA synthetase (AMP-forming)/AMP-acid ligase II/1-acyl-sn-glycerol-3-phosphate acyltransferase/SAM-dependent methyltransferase/acyl carrier protein